MISDNSLKILLVEDSPSDATLLQESILSSGATDISISVAKSLSETKKHLKNNHPDAVLLDLTLPDSSGLDTVREVRHISPDLPIVVLTGVDDENTGAEAVRTGVQDYLVKGQTDGRTITRVIRYSIERKKAEEALRKAHDELELRVKERTAELSRVNKDLSAEITERKLAQEIIVADQKQLRLLTTELILTEERERHEIATALHDSLGPILAFSKRELGTLQKSVPPPTAESLRNISDNITQAIKQTRTLTFDLSPPTLYTLGFEIAIEELLERFCEEHKLEYSFRNSDQPKPLTDPVKVLLYRSIRETLINIAKHAGAKLVKVVLSRAGNDIEIIIEDDGRGFDVSLLKEKTTGLGLFSVRERLRHIGGKLEIESKRGKGTHITLTAPLKIG